MEGLIETHSPDLVVIACNTASVQVLPALRARFAIPFVGTVPAIKPACAASQSKRVSVLGTEATVAREYTHALIRSFGRGCDVTLVGSGNLAALAEAALAGDAIDDEAIRAEIAPCFVADGTERTDTIVLACTHFRCCSRASSASPPGRCAGSIRPPRSHGGWLNCSVLPPASRRRTGPAIFTSGRAAPADLAAALGQFGLSAGEFAAV